VVRAGERSGDLTGAFRRLADQLEREERLRAKLLSAMLYPLLLGLAGGIAVTILLVLVLPRFADLLRESGGLLPASTASLLALGEGLRHNWLAALIAAVGIPAAVFAWAHNTPQGMRAWSAVSLRIPLIGSFRRQSLSARFSRLLGGLLGGGAPLLSALEDVERSIADPVAAEDVGRIRARVSEGATLRAALGEGDLWSPMLPQLVAVGEESGRLEQFLAKAAGIFEERTERNAQRLVTLLEPAMIVCFGGIVGFVALSLLQAIYSVNAGSFR
jgi:type II secretory pathway component PulF